MLATFPPAEVPVRLLAFGAVVTGEEAVYLLLDVDPKDAAVDVDLVVEDVMRAAPAVAWEDSHSERVPVGVHPLGFVSPMDGPMGFSR